LQLDFFIVPFQVFSEEIIGVESFDCFPKLFTLFKTIGSFGFGSYDIFEVVQPPKFIVFDGLKVVIADVSP